MTIAFSLLASLLAADPQLERAGNAPPAAVSPAPAHSKRADKARRNRSSSPATASVTAAAPVLAAAAVPAAASAPTPQQRRPAPARPPEAPPPLVVPAGARAAEPPPPLLIARASQPEARRFSLGARAGTFVPRTELGAGPLVAIEAGYVPPIKALRDRLRLALSVGFVSVAQRSQKFVPGRGFDAGFLQRTRIVPIELSATYELLEPRSGSPGFSAGAGFGLYPTSTEFTAFNTPTTEKAAGQAGFVLGRGSLPLGRGLVFLDVRYVEAHARLGPFGDVGTSDLSGFAFAGGYSVDL